MPYLSISKKLLLPMAAALASVGLSAQSIHITSGAKLVMTGAVDLVVNNMGLLNEGTITPGTSTVFFTGNGTTNAAGNNIAFISGLSGTSTTFNNITLNKSAGDVQLNTPITVAGALNFTLGNLRLNAFSVGLSTTGVLINEHDQSRVTGSGNISCQSTLAANVTANPGNMGLEITPGVNVGTVLMARTLVTDTVTINRTGLRRRFTVLPLVPPANMKATIRYHYLDSEAVSHNQPALVLWAATKLGTWTPQPTSIVDLKARVITQTNVVTLRYLTASESVAGSLTNPRAVMTGTGAAMGDITLQVSPNPVHTSFTLMITASYEKDDLIGLYDLSGRLLQEKKIHYTAGTNYVEWDIGSSPAGVYYLHFMSGGVESVKVIKQ